jgi:ribosomal-protein-alanine N-acetyltransferase
LSLLSPFTRRRLEPRDVRSVIAIQSESPEAAQWTAADYAHIDQQSMKAWVAESAADNSGSVAFLVARQAADEMEILNLAVRPDHRRRGAGAELLGAVIAVAAESGVTKLFLEVRESNAPAIAFYKRFRFTIAGRRPRYYSAPDEDALIFALALEVEPRAGL